jgi:hypothetical protein
MKKSIRKLIAAMVTALLFAGVFGLSAAAEGEAFAEPALENFFDGTNIPEIYDRTINVAPGESLQAALDQAKANRAVGRQSTKILLADGVYRESVSLNDGTSDSAGAVPFIAVEAAAGANPVISGALPVTSWTKNSDGTYTALMTDEMINLLTNNGATPEGQHERGWTEADIGTPNISVWANGILLAGDAKYYRVVPREDRMPGSFWMDFTKKTVTVWPKNDDFDPAKAELACRSRVFEINSTQNFVLRGVTIMGSGWVWGRGLDVGNSKNCLFENLVCTRNRDTGFGISNLRACIQPQDMV